MPLYAPLKEGGESYPVPPAEPLVGILAAIDYVGVHSSSGQYGDKVNDTLVLTYELEARDNRGSRFTINERLTLSFHEKAKLRKRIGVMRPGISDEALRTFDLESLIGSVVLVTVRHYQDRQGETRAGVQDVGTVPKMLMVTFGDEGLTLEGDYSEPTGLTKFLRGEGNKPCSSLVVYDADKFAKPRPAHEKRQPDERPESGE